MCMFSIANGVLYIYIHTQGPAEIPDDLCCKRNRWGGEFLLERPSSETQSISIAMECWSVQHQAFAVEKYF